MQDYPIYRPERYQHSNAQLTSSIYRNGLKMALHLLTPVQTINLIAITPVPQIAIVPLFLKDVRKLLNLCLNLKLDIRKKWLKVTVVSSTSLTRRKLSTMLTNHITACILVNARLPITGIKLEYK